MNREFTFCVFHDVGQNAERIFFHDFVAVVRDGERRPVERFDCLAQYAQTLVIRHRHKRPIDAALAAIRQNQLMQAVLFVEINFGFEFQLGLLDGLDELLEFLLVSKICFLFDVALG